MTAEKSQDGKDVYNATLDRILTLADCCEPATQAAFEKQEQTKRKRILTVRNNSNDLSEVLRAWADWLEV